MSMCPGICRVLPDWTQSSSPSRTWSTRILIMKGGLTVIARSSSMRSMSLARISVIDCAISVAASKGSGEADTMNKALITGGFGFIGYHLSVRLLADGFEVHAYDNCLRGSIDEHIKSLTADARYRPLLGDVVDPSGLSTLDDDYTHIFHAAAIVG